MRAPTLIPQSASKRDQYIAHLAQGQKTLRPSQSAGVRVSHTTLGVITEPDSVVGGGGTGSLSLYSLVAVHANYISCHPYDASTGEVSSDIVKIAKAFHLQRDAWAAATTSEDGFTTWGQAEIDGAFYGVDSVPGAPFVDDDLNPHCKRRRVQQEEPTFDATNPFVANVEWEETVYPSYVVYGRGKSNGNGEIIVAFELEHPITFPSRNYKYNTTSATSEEVTVTKMEIGPRHWVPIQRPMIICERDGDTVLQRRVMIRASDSFPL